MSGDGSELEALRQRLYVPGATQQDRDAFAAAEAEQAAARAAAASRSAVDEPAAGPPPMRDPGRPARAVPRRLLVAGAGVGVAALAAASASALLARPQGPTPRAPITLALTEEDRVELLQNLARGGAAGIGAYLVTHRSPPGLGDATSYTTAELHGRGPAVVAIDPDGFVPDAGRATVLVVADRSGAVSWTASRLGTAGSPAVRLIRITSRGGDQVAGALTTATFSYTAGRRPVRLAVTVPDDVRWGAAVVLSD